MKIAKSNKPGLLSGALAALALAWSIGGARAAQAADAKTPVIHRIVVQVTLDGEDQWNGVLNQVENLRKGFAPDSVLIEVVTHGNATGLVLAKNAIISDRVKKIEASGTVFSYCANTQKKNNVKAEELTPGVVIVPSGVVHVVKRQEEGWAYIKGGA